MDEKIRERIALFRYGLIAPMLNNQVDRDVYLAEISAKKHVVPHYGEKEYAPKTILIWLRLYQLQGFEALKPKRRSDKGISRIISAEQQKHLLNLRQRQLKVPVSVFYNELIKQGEILPHELSYFTLHRLLKKNNMVGKELIQEPNRRRFAYDTVNTLWQGDLSDGPYIIINGKKVKTYLIAFVDDCSRLVPYGQFFLSEKFDGLRIVLKEALIRRGIPKMIYTDNGKIYRSNTLEFACANLGIILTHTQPYDAASKGKIERLFRTVKTRFIPLLKVNPVFSLEELNKRFFEWLETDYHRKVHASLNGKTPLEVYLSQVDSIKMLEDPLVLDPLFLKREERKVKHDGTLSLNGQLYQVPPRYIGQKVEVRYDENEVHIYEDGKPTASLELVRFSDNAHVKRDRPRLSFKATLGEEDANV